MSWSPSERARVSHHGQSSASDWYSLFPNPVVAESILDRVVNVAHHIAMEGKSYRPNKRPTGPSKEKGS